MDFKMDRSSWLMIAFMLATMAFFVLDGRGLEMGFANVLKGIGFAILVVIILIALMSIPVLIYCYFVNKIPDIDYSIRAAFAFTIIGIISEIII